MNGSIQSIRSKKDGHVNRTYANYIAAGKIHAFEVLFNSLVSYYGSARKVEAELGVSVDHSVITTAFKNKKLSEYYAKKILIKFNEVKAAKRKAANNRQARGES
jgi:hypothetical protein